MIEIVQYTIKSTCDDNWNHPVVEMPSAVQSIISLSVSRNHSFGHLKCSFLRKLRYVEKEDGCANLAMSRVSLKLDEGRRSGRTPTQSVPSDHQSRYEFTSGTIPPPMNARKRTSIRSRSHVFCARSLYAQKTTLRRDRWHSSRRH